MVINEFQCFQFVTLPHITACLTGHVTLWLRAPHPGIVEVEIEHF